MKIFVDGAIYEMQKNSGIARYYNELFHQMEALDNHTEICLLLGKWSQRKRPKGKNIRPIIDWKFNAPQPHCKFRYILDPLKNNIANTYWRYIKEGVFHSTYFTTYKNLRIPQVLTVHDMIYEKFPQFFCSKRDSFFIQQKKKCIDAANAIICVSKNTKKDLLDHYDIPESKIHVVYHGVHPKFTLPLKNNRSNLAAHGIRQPFLLFVGARYIYKNFSNLAKAYSLMDKKQIQLVVVGPMFSREEKKYLKSIGVLESILHLGFVPDKLLIQLYQSTTAFVFPSYYEGFGFPLLEAMACGAPVVAAKSSSLIEVGQGVASFFDPDDCKDIASTIQQTITENRSSDRIQKGIARAKGFTWKKTAQSVLKIYKSLT